jgi:hypothetical protein
MMRHDPPPSYSSNQPYGQQPYAPPPMQPQSGVPAEGLVGVYGVDRFYTGSITLGIVKLITLGGCGVWWLVDIIMIATGSYKDAYGRPLARKL